MDTPLTSTSNYTRLVQEYRQREREYAISSREQTSVTQEQKAKGPQQPLANSEPAAVGRDVPAEMSREQLEKEKRRILAELEARDKEVRRHEEAHSSVGGKYASAPEYETAQGPDGKEYAVGGNVQIDTSPIENDPEATLTKSEIVEQAALAPAQPSAQDLSVAASARAMGNEARSDIQAEIRAEILPPADAEIAADAEQPGAEQADDAPAAAAPGQPATELPQSVQNTSDEVAADVPVEAVGSADRVAGDQAVNSPMQQPEAGLAGAAENRFTEPEPDEVLPAAAPLKTFSFGLHFPRSFVGAEVEAAQGRTRAEQLKYRFDDLGLSYPPQPTGQQLMTRA